MNGADRLRWRLPSSKQFFLTAFEYLWAVLVILNGNSVYHADAEQDHFLLELCALSTWALLAVEMSCRKCRVKQNWAVLAVALVVYFVSYISVRQESTAVTVFVWLFVVGLPGLVLLFAQLQEMDVLPQLFRRLFDVVVALALLSLYYWIFGVMLQLFTPNCYKVISWGTVHYVPGFDGLHFVTQYDTTFFPELYILRNSSIFAEAPMFNLWLDLALAGELFLTKRTSKLRVTVLVIAILTTMSTTGILFMGMCLVIHIIRNVKYMDGKQRLLVLLGGSILLPALAGVLVYTMVLKSDTQSYLMRLTDYTAGVRLWWDYPVFGAGFGNLRTLQPYSYSPEGVMGFSNSLTAVLGTGGLWIALMYYIPYFGLLSSRASGDTDRSCFQLCYVFLFCTTAFFARYIAVVMIAYGWVILLGRKKKL